MLIQLSPFQPGQHSTLRVSRSVSVNPPPHIDYRLSHTHRLQTPTQRLWTPAQTIDSYTDYRFLHRLQTPIQRFVSMVTLFHQIDKINYHRNKRMNTKQVIDLMDTVLGLYLLSGSSLSSQWQRTMISHQIDLSLTFLSYTHMTVSTGVVSDISSPVPSSSVCLKLSYRWPFISFLRVVSIPFDGINQYYLVHFVCIYSFAPH